jgi:lipopolysaccharide/colanic/teichoic acid biosynthesis glycosyltransferase
LALLDQSSVRRQTVVTGVRSVDDFRALLVRERAGADRNEHEFSLVVFDETDAPKSRLSDTLRVRIRQTDDVGWLDREHIAVLLSYTSATGARAFADDVLRTMEPSQLSCRIYTYPGEWLQSETPGAPGTPNGKSRRSQQEVQRADAPPAGPANMNASTVASPDWNDVLTTKNFPMWKRVMDIMGAGIGLLLVAPLCFLVAAIIRITSPGPAVLKQRRVGRNGKEFTIWKFRTMRVNADVAVHQNHLSNLITSDTPMTKLEGSRDPRIFPFGRIIRRCYIDELPQLVNVLRGDMTLVGPRPCIPYEARQYRLWQKRRFDATPGMTGLWQVSGKNRTTFKEMIRFDIIYARNLSFLMDVTILLKTVPAIIGEVAAVLLRKSAPVKQAVDDSAPGA